MIDKEARDRSARLLEQFWSGQITNRQLEGDWPDSKDGGIIAVGDFVWLFYDDFKRHRVSEAHRSDTRLNRHISLCIRFMRSDEEYSWPHLGTLPFPRPVAPWAVVASLGLLALWNRVAQAREERYWQAMRAHGDVEAWPFRHKRTHFSDDHRRQ